MPDPDVDLAAALGLGGLRTSGAPVASYDALDGGLTSTMLALRHDDGAESVLRLMTVEPWRTHGAELTTRASGEAQLAMAGTAGPGPDAASPSTPRASVAERRART